MLGPSDLVAQRFRVLAHAGAGGMGDVYRARDEHQDRDVAVKVLRLGSTDEHERFLQEARVLESLVHSAVVRYVAHGRTEANAPFLAMEWLDGEDLATRLVRGPLSIVETLCIGERVAEALHAAHECGVVHRDVKPANIFVGAPGTTDVRVLDFGVARTSFTGRALTRTGALVGTPSYMAPEQAGSAPVGPAADLFALGCVLFECLAGTPAFGGDTVLAVLAKILFADAPRASTVRADVPVGLDDLVADLLSKAPSSRPRTAEEVAVRARAVRSSESVRAPAAARALSASERRVVSVVAGSTPGAGPGDTLAGHDAVAAPVPRSGAELRTLPDGSLVCVFRGGVARDEATAAVRYAHALRRARPELALAVATGRATTGTMLPAGDAIDRAVALLADARAGVVRIDEPTAELVADRIGVVTTADGFEASPMLEPAPRERLVLGKRTPCVGRARELAFLRATLDESAENGAARAVLVTAPAGLGKSRLRRELAHALVRDGVVGKTLLAHAEAGGETRTFGLAGQLVRSALGVVGEPGPDLYERFAAYLAPLIADDTRIRTATFLAEAAGGEAPLDAHPWLAAARREPGLLANRIQVALDEWIAAEVARGPVLVVLEDLHWADEESVATIERWLAQLRARPLAVLALARPEVHERFPALWSGYDVPEIKLGPLPRAACERLAREAAPDFDAAAVASVVETSGGHPLLLEELLRAHALGAHVEQPTLAALLEARVLRLAPAQRRVVRAASVLGERFQVAGAAAIADVELPAAIDALAAAERDEIVVRVGASDDSEWVFRHALLRDAAYAMLTAPDRRAGHRAAAAWLRSGAVRDRSVLTDHLERGAETDEQRLDAATAFLMGAGKHRQALDQLNRALSLAQAAGDPATQVRSHNSLAIIYATGAEVDAAREHVRMARELLATHPDRHAECEVLKAESIIAFFNQDWAAGAEFAGRALEIAEAAGFPYEAAVSAHNLAEAVFRAGDRARAMESTRKSLDIARRHAIMHLVEANERLIALADALDQPSDANRARLDGCIRNAERRGNAWDIVQCWFFAAIVDQRRHETGGARHCLTTALNVAREHGFQTYVHECRRGLEALDADIEIPLAI